MSRPPVVVMDASVAIAIVRAEPEGQAAESMISGLTVAGTRIVVPSHFWLEVINALLTRRHWPGEHVLEAIHALDQFGFETRELDRGLIILSLDIGERHRLTSYDAAYVALAMSMEGWSPHSMRQFGLPPGTRVYRSAPRGCPRRRSRTSMR